MAHRLIDHETHAAKPPMRWVALADRIVFRPREVGQECAAEMMTRIVARDIENATASFIRKLDDLMFWEPARYALENGGCRQ